MKTARWICLAALGWAAAACQSSKAQSGAGGNGGTVGNRGGSGGVDASIPTEGGAGGSAAAGNGRDGGASGAGGRAGEAGGGKGGGLGAAGGAGGRPAGPAGTATGGSVRGVVRRGGGRRGFGHRRWPAGRCWRRPPIRRRKYRPGGRRALPVRKGGVLFVDGDSAGIGRRQVDRKVKELSNNPAVHDRTLRTSGSPRSFLIWPHAERRRRLNHAGRGLQPSRLRPRRGRHRQVAEFDRGHRLHREVSAAGGLFPNLDCAGRRTARHATGAQQCRRVRDRSQAHRGGRVLRRRKHSPLSWKRARRPPPRRISTTSTSSTPGRISAC